MGTKNLLLYKSVSRLLKYLGMVLIVLLLTVRIAYSQVAYSTFIETTMNQVDSVNLMTLVKQLSGEIPVEIEGQTYSIITRRYDDSLNFITQKFIEGKFREYGYEPVLQDFPDPAGTNIIATKTGTLYPDKYFIICAHYDSYNYSGVAPGADDNATGTAAVLEAARLLRNIPTDYSIKFITFDVEEIGLYGSKYYAKVASEQGEQIEGLINLDMLGYDSDNDGKYAIGRSAESLQLGLDLMSVDRYYIGLKPYFKFNVSDDSSFLPYHFSAGGIIEDTEGDFNPYYHTENETFDKLNTGFFYKLSKVAIGTLLSKAIDHCISIDHTPLKSAYELGEREVKARIESKFPIATGVNQPKLFYSTDSINFTSLNAVNKEGNMYTFMIPGFPLNTTVYYYLAAQTEGTTLSSTLPSTGYGFSSPGTIAPKFLMKYSILKAAYHNQCSSGTPLVLPGMSVRTDTIIIENGGRIHDLNVKVDFTHEYVSDLRFKLIGPDGTTVHLSGPKGEDGDNYTGTIFDDESEIEYDWAYPPFSCTMQPSEKLSAFYGKEMEGVWQLKIWEYRPQDAGTLNYWCLDFMSIDSTLILDSRPLAVKGKLSLFPNPVMDELNVEFHMEEQTFVNIQFFDLYGQSVKSISAKTQKGRNIFSVPVNDFVAGIYICRLTGNNTQLSERFIVIK